MHMSPPDKERRERTAWLPDRVDLGLVLPGVKAQGRLETTTTVGGGRGA